MRLSEEQALQDNNRFANCNALAELKYCGWEIPHRKAITNDEIRFYAWLCRSAIVLLKEQQEIVRCKNCIHNGKIEKCVLAAIAAEKDYPLFMLDNHGEWYCADGKRKEGGI